MKGPFNMLINKSKKFNNLNPILSKNSFTLIKDGPKHIYINFYNPQDMITKSL